VNGAVAVLHVGRAADATCFYYVMELADDLETGPAIDPDRYVPRTLRAELRRHERLPAPECLQIGLALASALATLHQNKLVHRDVKPSNIIFVNGHAKLADIGLVTDSEHTATSVGTEGYVPPEGPGSPQADVYSLGMVLYEAATGNDRQQYPTLPTDFKDLPDQDACRFLNTIILRACHPDRAQRYATAEAMRQDLDRAASGHPPAPRRQPWPPTLKTVTLATGAILLLSLATFVLWLPRHRQGAPTLPASPGVGIPEPSGQDSGPIGPYGHRLRLIRSFASPSVPSWRSALVGCGNGDGEPEIFAVFDGRLFEFSMLGDELFRWKPPDLEATDVSLTLLANGNQDACLEAFVSWRVQDQLFISVINANGGEFKRFTNRVATWMQEDGRPADSGITAAQLVDLESDGQLELLARLHTGAGRRSRGLCCYAYTDGTLRWFFPTAPNVSEVACVDLNNDGVLDVAFGTQAPDNGNTAPDGTTDARTFLYAVSGKTSATAPTHALWRVDLWNAGSQAHVLPDRTRRALYVWCAHSGSDLRDLNLDPAQGEVIRVSYDGAVEARYAVDKYLSACTLVDRGSNQPPHLLAIDQAATLHVLSETLDLVAKTPLFDVTRGRAQAAFFGQSDLDEDGRPEILLLCTEEEHVAGDNMGIQNESPAVRRFHQVSIVVLDATYRPIAHYLLAAKMKNVPNITLWTGRLEADQPVQILVLGKDVLVLQLDPPKSP